MKQSPKIEAYKVLLMEWNSRFNLYSANAYDRLDFHIQDCINMAEIIGGPKKWVLDMGSGSGLPAIILAIMSPNNTIIAVESKEKKSLFLKEAKRHLELDNFNPIHSDIHEYLHKTDMSPDFVTAKAFAPYPKLKMICKGVSKRNYPTLLVPVSKAQLESLPKNCINHHYSGDDYYYLQEKI